MTNQVPQHAATYAELRPAAQLRSLRWIIRRAIIGIVALAVFAVGGAWLLHASIEGELPAVERTANENRLAR